MKLRMTLESKTITRLTPAARLWHYVWRVALPGGSCSIVHCQTRPPDVPGLRATITALIATDELTTGCYWTSRADPAKLKS